MTLEKTPDKDNIPFPPEQLQRYAVYSLRRTTEDGLSFTRSFIVIKNGYNVIVRFTRLQDYAGVYARRTYRPVTADPESKLHFICKMLNYALVEHGAEFGIRHVFDVTKPMLEQFFNSYAQEKRPDGTYRGQETIERCVATVTAFMERLCAKFGGYMKLSREDLYNEKTVVTKKGQLVKRKIPAFQAVGFSQTDPPFRDMPEKVMEILLPLAFRYARDIAFGVCLQAFAGLRAGEVCNVRQESSPLGAGIRFVSAGGSVIKAEIDLRRELALRSDGAEVGKIKKERLQCVYPAFLGAFLQAYELHKEYLKQVSFEPEYAPMFVNRNGKAMSYETYRLRFKRLVHDRLRPALADSADPELRIYAQLLCENELGTHALRHWYTVQLVLRGEDIANVKFWRGDKSPESAFEYLQNKGDLTRELRESAGRLLDVLLGLGEKAHES